MRSWDLYAYFAAGFSDQASTVYALSTGRGVESIQLPRDLYYGYGLLGGFSILLLIHAVIFGVLFMYRLLAPRFIKSKRLEVMALSPSVAFAGFAISFFGITAIRNIVEVTVGSLIPATIITPISATVGLLLFGKYYVANYLVSK